MMEEILTNLSGLLTLYLALIIGLVSPGPNFVAITAASVQNRNAGYGVALGVSLGTAFWAGCAVTGIASLLARFEFATLIVSILGGAYLLWLGVNALKSSWQDLKSPPKKNHNVQPKFIPSTKATSLKYVGSGLAVQLGNPKAILFWLALTAMLIRPDTPLLVNIFIVAGSFMIAVSWHLLLAFAFSSGPLRKRYLNNKPIFTTVFGILFVGFALRIFYGVMWE